jgi:hypothetical protein
MVFTPHSLHKQMKIRTSNLTKQQHDEPATFYSVFHPVVIKQQKLGHIPNTEK